MPELTLARFILEFSLMNYDMITMRDSKVAAASMFMALRMNNKTGWNKTLEYYSGNKKKTNQMDLIVSHHHQQNITNILSISVHRL